MKWLGVVLLVIVGVLATILAVEYLTVPIHSLPSYIPGGHSGTAHYHKVNGHYHKRGAVAALVAIVAFVGAGYWAYRLRKPEEAAPVAVAAPTTADQALSGPPPAAPDRSTEEDPA